MDAMTTAQVGIGSAAVTAALVQGLRSYGLAGSQKLIFLWSLILASVMQVIYVLSQGEPATVQNISAAVLAGITSGLAAGGLHDHATSAGHALSNAAARVKAPPPPTSTVDATVLPADSVPAGTVLKYGEGNIFASVTTVNPDGSLGVFMEGAAFPSLPRNRFRWVNPPV